MIRISSVLFFLALAMAVTPGQAQTYGGSVAIGGGELLVGETGNQSLPGMVYVYRADGEGWREVDRLSRQAAPGPPDGFGQGLAADGARLVVGAPMESDGAGAAYVYERADDGRWIDVARLSVDRGGGAFGTAVTVVGDVILISAPGDGGGAVSVFERSADGGWERSARLGPEGGDDPDRFGTTLAFDGESALIGTPARFGGNAAVYAYSYDRQNGAWTGQGQLTAELGDRSGFGSAFGIRDGVAYVGAPWASGRAGVVVQFRRGADGWSPIDRLTPFAVQPNLQFGSAIAFDGTTLWIGAPGSGPGAVYRYDGDESGDWIGVERMASRALEDRASFGSVMAVVGDVAVVGAAGVDSRAGAVVAFQRGAEGQWDERQVLINEVRGLPAIAGGEVDCTGESAAGFLCSSVNIMSFLPTNAIGGGRGTRVNDIWGWTDPETGVEYAIVGRTDGTAFVDLSDPLRPVFVGDLPKTEGSRSSIWRDMKVYRDHVYVVADAADQHGVQVFDLRQLRAVRSPPATFAPTYTYDGIASAHNIVINEATGFAYAVGSSSGGETCGGGLHMISLEDPGRPTFAGCFADPSTGRRRTGYSHDAQCVTYQGPDEDHRGREICFGSNETALSIADVTDKANPVAIAAVSYPNVAYTHQGWLTDDHRYFYLNDEGDEPQGLVDGTRTLIWDVTDLDDPILANEHIATTTTTDHNLYVRGDRMYQSNYGSGLRILDVSDPANPVEIGFLDTTPYGDGGGSWSNYPFFESGLVVATSMSEGLFVLRSTARPPLIP